MLGAAEEEEAERRRQARMEVDDLRGVIEEFLDRPIPEDWLQWDASRRDLFWHGQGKGSSLHLVPRERACAVEIMREGLNDKRPVIPSKDSRRVNQILSSLPGWEPGGIMRFGKIYGHQRGFHRVAEAGKALTNRMLTFQSVNAPEKLTDSECAPDCARNC